jgi:hypothetical protein
MTSNGHDLIVDCIHGTGIIEIVAPQFHVYFKKKKLYDCLVGDPAQGRMA